MGAMVEGAGGLDAAPEDKPIFPRDRQTRTTVPQRTGSMNLGIPWPKVSATQECRDEGVISYSRAESCAALSSLGPRGRSVTACHHTQVTQVQSEQAGCMVGT